MWGKPFVTKFLFMRMGRRDGPDTAVGEWVVGTVEMDRCTGKRRAKRCLQWAPDLVHSSVGTIHKLLKTHTFIVTCLFVAHCSLLLVWHRHAGFLSALPHCHVHSHITCTQETPSAFERQGRIYKYFLCASYVTVFQIQGPVKRFVEEAREIYTGAVVFKLWCVILWFL